MKHVRVTNQHELTGEMDVDAAAQDIHPHRYAHTSSHRDVPTSAHRIRRATLDDLPNMMDVYERARLFMIEHGNSTQWPEGYPSEEIVRDDIEHGRAFVLVAQVGAHAGEKILAQFALQTTPEASYEHINGAWLDDAPYATIHRIASSGIVARAACECIRWCVDRVGNVRADTHRANRGMQHALEACGFARCGLIELADVRDDRVRIAYQRHAW